MPGFLQISSVASILSLQSEFSKHAMFPTTVLPVIDPSVPTKIPIIEITTNNVKLKRIILGVGKKNSHAIHVYKKNGFNIIKDNKNSHIMMKKI